MEGLLPRHMLHLIVKLKITGQTNIPPNNVADQFAPDSLRLKGQVYIELGDIVLLCVSNDTCQFQFFNISLNIIGRLLIII